MVEHHLRILQVSTYDFAGGAERVAWDLFRSYRAQGCSSWLAVGHKRSDDPDVLPIRNSEGLAAWSHFWWGVRSRLQRVNGGRRLSRLAGKLAEPGALLDYYRGVENFRFPGTWDLLRMTPQPPDVVHCHNLHTDYFDLRVLPRLSHQVPTILTLHDAWLLSGHCAHSFDCERWKIGCGECPDLTIYPAIRRDATDYNWRRKRDIFANCRLYVASPSQWLMSKVQESILVPAIVEARVIPYGVDLDLFHPADQKGARSALGIAQDSKVLLFAASGIRHNMWKDYETMRAAVAKVATSLQGHGLLFIALGEDAPPERIGEAEIRFVPYLKSAEAVARYYQAADVYVHAARADTFPNTILEALACRTPVVATAVGGIPEQVKSLRSDSLTGNLPSHGLDEATGMLVPPRDANGMAHRIEQLLTHERLLEALAENAARDAQRRFNLRQQVESYLGWYKELRDRSTHRNDADKTLSSVNVAGV